jgi:adenosine deaminase
MTHISQVLIEKLPKTDLHCHLDGSMRIATLIDLAKQENVTLKSYEPERLMEIMRYGRVRKNLEEYLAGFEPLVAVLQTKESLERVFFELCEDAALENIWHLEVRYCPALHTNKGLSVEDVVEACIEAAKRATSVFGISVVQILCGLKHHEGESILKMAQLAATYRSQGVVGFDLAGPEDGFPIRDHLEAIYFARKHHLSITLHAGESYGPASIAQAVQEAGAHRVGHGTSLVNDQALLSYIVDNRIGVEACPISNWHTGAVSSLDAHPLRKLLESGVRVSINTDNRLCSDTSVTEEIMAVVEHLDLNLKDIQRLLLNGFKSAFLPYEKRMYLLEAFNQEWQKLTKVHGLREEARL